MIHLCGVGVGELRERCLLFLPTINSLYCDSNRSLNSQPENVCDSCSVPLRSHASIDDLHYELLHMLFTSDSHCRTFAWFPKVSSQINCSRFGKGEGEGCF